MIIVGAKGFAKEVLEVLYERGIHSLVFFDDVSEDLPERLYDTFPIIRNINDLKKLFIECPDFVLGVGGARTRCRLATKMLSIGGKLKSVVSDKASIGHFGTSYDAGVAILGGVIITNDVKIGEGSIINKSSILSHDVKVGKYCEVSPGARLLGRVTVGNYTSIGSNAVVLPNITIGDDCVVGAGSVVTKNISNGQTVIGIPARKMR